ncbi:MAG: molybdopterin-dependent oxidoreductase, partial [Chloroflexi bacterium]|nr:molybdopterin-dependent oxidoreductase [Chloroflexota bacterium]
MKIVHAVCPHDCPDSCSMLVTVVNGRAEKIRGNPDHPITQGFLCAKVNNYLQWTYNPNRVLYPRRRIGPKGSGNWERITWDEAIATIAEQFREIVAAHGPEAILPYSYSGTLGLLNFASMDRRFFYRLGATLLHRTICSTAGSVAYEFTLGRAGGTDPEAFSRAKLIIVWGSNPVTSHVHLMPFLNEAQKQGAHLVVIDPRRTRTARRADRFLQPRPGTDAALALGMMHVIIEENLYDAEYVQQHTIGFDALCERVRDFPPLRAAAITGLDANEIVDLAR